MPDGGYLLKDLSSANGTFVNGEQVHRRVLNSGDTIALASSTQLRFLSRASTPEQSSDRLLDLGRLVQSLAPMLAGPEPPRYALDLLVRAAQAASPQHELLPIACLRPRLERIVLDATEPVTAEFAGFDLQGSTYALVAVAIERAVQHVAAAAEHPTALGLRMTEDSATKDAPHRQAHLLLQPENGTGLPEAITPPPSSESAPTVPPDLALPLAASWAQVVGVGGSMHCDASSLSISFPLL
jgi:pSer/pThr/pTyr-binding forkhead associated (FHA) protein